MVSQTLYLSRYIYDTVSYNYENNYEKKTCEPCKH